MAKPAFEQVEACRILYGWPLIWRQEKETEMGLLYIDLQEGFTDDAVVVRVNGQEVFRREKVRTRLQLGLAESVEVTVAEGSADIEVVVVSRNLSKTMKVQVSAETYVGVSIVEGEIDYRISDDLIGYV